MVGKGKTLKGLAGIIAMYTVAQVRSPLFQSQGTMVGKLEYLVRAPGGQMGLHSGIVLLSLPLSLPPSVSCLLPPSLSLSPSLCVLFKTQAREAVLCSNYSVA